MGCIHRVASIDPAGSHNADGRFALFHVTKLHGGSVGAQQVAVGQIEGVGHVAGRVVGGRVQGLEVVIVRFHFGAIGHRVAQANADIDYPVDRAGEGMLAA